MNRNPALRSVPFRVGALAIGGAACALTLACTGPADEFRSAFADGVERVWVGPDFYANRLQDWRLADGRAEAVQGSDAKPMRTLHLLTRTLGEAEGTLEMSVRLGAIAAGPGDPARASDTWAGVLLGAGGEDVDYRISSLVHHWPSEDGGLIIAVDGSGAIVVRDNSVFQGFRAARADIPTDAWPLLVPETHDVLSGETDDRRLELTAEPEPNGEGYRLEVQVFDGAGGQRLGQATYRHIDAGQLTGNMALVAHRSSSGTGPGAWFSDWRISGSKVEQRPDRALGPIVGAFHTVSRGVLKMTAQLVPVGPTDASTATLEVQRSGGWETAAVADIAPLSYTATFRVENWDESVATPYRVVYELQTGPRAAEPHAYEGTVRAVPWGKEEIVLAALNCQHISGGDGRWNGSHFWWPHEETAARVALHEPDVLFYAGDQIYESGLEGIVREPLDEAALDYLNHWYRFVWAFRELSRDVPTVMIPDDHDVYHGNIWGAGGIKAEGPLTPFSDNGGYGMDAEWVNAVHRTQVSNLPDPVDPEPIAQGISVYHTSMEYAGVSFGIVADRMFKSSPTITVPDGDVVNGWPQNPDFDPVTEADVPGAVLLGDRQLRFLEDWAADWSGGTWMKVLLSQTLFANLATLPPEANSGAVLPSLGNPEPDEYPDDYRLAADMDSNGWPQSGRDRALATIRKGFAFHVVGDQHLGSFIRYGVERFDDAGYGFVVPSIANIWPRRWFPAELGEGREPGAPRYTGRYYDGFGNPMTVFAVSNPVQSGQLPAELYDRVPGYGIVRFLRSSREIVAENWPRWVDPAAPEARQYFGWPITVTQGAGHGEPAAWLPGVAVEGMTDPVVQLVHEGTGEVVYTLRIAGTEYVPPVFDANTSYTLRIGEPGTERWRELNGLRPAAPGSTIETIVFDPEPVER